MAPPPGRRTPRTPAQTPAPATTPHQELTARPCVEPSTPQSTKSVTHGPPLVRKHLNKSHCPNQQKSLFCFTEVSSEGNGDYEQQIEWLEPGLRAFKAVRRKPQCPSFIQSQRPGFSFSTNLKQHRARDHHQHNRHDDHPPDRRDEFVSAIGTNSYVQTKVLLAGWARLHYRQCILSVSCLSICPGICSAGFHASVVAARTLVRTGANHTGNKPVAGIASLLICPAIVALAFMPASFRGAVRQINSIVRKRPSPPNPTPSCDQEISQRRVNRSSGRSRSVYDFLS